MRCRFAFAALTLVLTFTACTTDDAEGDESEGMTTPSSSTADTAESLGCAATELNIDTSDGATDPVMDTWGSACTADADCVAILGEGAICEFEAVVYELPNGYCTKPCSLPDGTTRVVLDDPACDPAGGVACIGQQPLFERCARICTDDGQCNRPGYECRAMPLIGVDTDPMSCLMPDCCETNC